MDFQQFVNRFFEEEQKNGKKISKETVKKVIEKIIDEFVKIRPTTQAENVNYAINYGSLIVLICQKANELGIDITPQEACQEVVKALAKHSSDK